MNNSIMTGLISKEEMIHQSWYGFDKYPKLGEAIVLHIAARHIKENKISHDFIPIKSFNTYFFDWRQYAPKMKGVSWNVSWLPIDKLKANDNDRCPERRAVQRTRKRVSEEGTRTERRTQETEI